MSCLLGMAYQSNLLSFLVKARLEEPIDDYKDVVEQDVRRESNENKTSACVLPLWSS